MKTKSILIALLSFVIVGGMFAKDNKKEIVVFSVNMDCDHCVKKIEKNIPFEKGVKGLEVDLEKKLVTVTYNASKTNVAKLQEGFKKIDYIAVEVKAKECCSEKATAACKEKSVDDKKATEACKSKESDTKAKKEKK